jgi:dCMP deaminase
MADKFAEVYNRGMSPGAPQGVRPSKDRAFLDMADLVAQRSNCRRRHFGAVIVKDGCVISTGYNGTGFGIVNCVDGGCPRCADADAGILKPGEGYDRCVCVHAEANAILLIARNGGASAKGATMYTQGAPCISCLKEITQAGIAEVVYRQQSEYKDRPDVQAAYDLVVAGSGVHMRRSSE